MENSSSVVYLTTLHGHSPLKRLAHNAQFPFISVKREQEISSGGFCSEYLQLLTEQSCMHFIWEWDSLNAARLPSE